MNLTRNETVTVQKAVRRSENKNQLYLLKYKTLWFNSWFHYQAANSGIYCCVGESHTVGQSLRWSSGSLDSAAACPGG